MTDEINLDPTEVEKRLIWLWSALSLTQQELAAADATYVRARQRYEVAKARAFLNATGSVDSKKSQAIVETEKEALDAEISEQVVRSLREKLRTLHTRAEIARSLRASVGSAMALGNPGGS